MIKKSKLEILAETILRTLYTKTFVRIIGKYLAFPTDFFRVLKLSSCCKILIVSFNNEEEGSLYLPSVVKILHQEKFEYNGINLNEESKKV